MVKQLFIPPSLSFLVPCTAAFIGGIIWQYQEDSSFFLMGIPVITIGVLSLFIQPLISRITGIIFVGCMFTAGLYLASKQQQVNTNLLATVDGKIFDIQGQITDIQPLQSGRLKQRVTVAVESIRESTSNNSSWLVLPMTIQLYLTVPLSCSLYDRIIVWKLKNKKGIGQSGYYLYLLNQGVCATFFPKKESIQLIPQSTDSIGWFNGIQRKLYVIRQTIRRNIQTKCPSQPFYLFSTIFLGNRQIPVTFLSQQKEMFKWWGISHHLARSGLHLVIFIALLSLLLALLPLSFFLKQCLLVFIILIYAVFSWPSISFIRALTTFGLYKFCTFLNLPIQFLHLLTLVTLIVLIHSPVQLFFLDFQLSFGLTFALAWLNHSNIQHKALRLP